MSVTLTSLDAPLCVCVMKGMVCRAMSVCSCHAAFGIDYCHCGGKETMHACHHYSCVAALSYGMLPLSWQTLCSLHIAGIATTAVSPSCMFLAILHCPVTTFQGSSTRAEQRSRCANQEVRDAQGQNSTVSFLHIMHHRNKS